MDHLCGGDGDFRHDLCGAGFPDPVGVDGEHAAHRRLPAGGQGAVWSARRVGRGAAV